MRTLAGLALLVLVAFAVFYWNGYRRGLLNLRRMGLSDEQINAGHAMIAAWRDYERRMTSEAVPATLLAQIAFARAGNLRDAEVVLTNSNPAFALSEILGAVRENRRLTYKVSAASQAISWQGMTDLAIARYRQGDYLGSEAAAADALELAESLLGPKAPDTAASLCNLAEALRSQGKFAAAAPLFERAQSIYEARAVPEERSSLAMVMNNRALVAEEQGLFDLAERLHLGALSIRQRVFGETSMETASSLNGLGNLYLSRGRHLDAERLLGKAVALFTRMAGAAHPIVASVRANLANSLVAQGKLAEGIREHRDALHAVERTVGPNSGDLIPYLQNLAQSLRIMGELTEASTLEARVDAIQKTR
ncbi:MAG: tetratricopeptide repeat protein [Tepidisphaera sp.]